MMIAKNIQKPVENLIATNDRRIKKRIKLDITVILGILALIALTLSLAYVAQRAHIMNLGYQLENIENLMADARREQEFIKLNIVKAQSLDRIERVAITELGMTRPSDKHIIVMQPPYESQPEEATDTTKGFLALAADWVSNHWPRITAVEAVGDGY